VRDRVLNQRPNGKREQIRVRKCQRNYAQFADRLLQNFVDVILRQAEPLVPAADVLPALELLDEAYRSVQPLPLPWLRPQVAAGDSLRQEEACHV
jgi:hypothetical protein